MFEIIKRTKAFLFDLDGTIYLDDVLIGDVKNTLNTLRDNGITVAYLTNNSSKTDGEYLEKLKRIGIYDERDVFYSSLDGAVDYLNFYHKDLTVYPVATKEVVNNLEKEGIKVVKTGEMADVVLLTFDKEID
jgi:HAD superfamily hydrolase (TIGR01450 family)